MTIAMFIEQSRSALEPILDLDGAVLYSAAATLRPGRYYILGLNPGGGTGQTIGDCLNAITGCRQNAYLDEDWSSDKRLYGAGGHPLQRHLAYLMQELRTDVRSVCASNLIFTRSVDQHGADYPRNAEICWPVHRTILGIVRPSVIISCGNGDISPYAFLMQTHYGKCGTWPKEETHPAGHGTWQCKAFKTDIDGLSVNVLGMPHLSRYSIEGRAAVLSWIKRMANVVP